MPDPAPEAPTAAVASPVHASGGAGRPRMPVGATLVALILALCFLAGAAGWTLARLERPRDLDGATVGFLQDMRSHHEGALALARIRLVSRGEARVREHAEEVLLFQSYETGVMDTVLRVSGLRPEDRPEEAMGWMMGMDAGPDMPVGMAHSVPVGSMPGLATDEELELLSTAGDDADEVFIALMVDHHAAGVEMAEAAVGLVGDDDVRELARRMARSQEIEIFEMAQTAERFGFDLTPPGVEHDVFDGTIPAFGPRDS